MNTTDYKAAKLAEYDKAFSKLLEPGDDGQYVGYYDNKHCCFIDQTKQVKAFISQTIDELDTQWRERIRKVQKTHREKYDKDAPEGDRGYVAGWNDCLGMLDAILSEGKDGGEAGK